MYRHRPQRFTTSQQPIFKLSAFQEDEKLRFVDSVCATLMTSRFGDGAMYTLNRRFRGTADEPFDFLDLLKDAEIGWHEAATFLGRTLLGRAFSGGSLQKPARSKGIGLTDTTLGRNPTPCETPANLGRGSPTFLGRSCSRLLLRS